MKNTADVLAKPLYKLFKYSLEADVFSSDLKTSNVVPVHKKNDAQNKCNYRPVSLLCNVSKIFERLVYIKIYSFLMENKLLSPHNSGFHSFEGEVPCPRTQHLNNVLRLKGGKHAIYLKILHQVGFEPARQAATSAERKALTITPCLSPLYNVEVSLN